MFSSELKPIGGFIRSYKGSLKSGDPCENPCAYFILFSPLCAEQCYVSLSVNVRGFAGFR